MNNHVKIFIVEDSPTQAEELRYILEKRGFEVSAACNGKEALSLLDNMRPDIVISDIVMPGMDGYELCKRLRADARFKHIPVILVTTLSDPRDVIKGLEAGANNFIVKPYDERYLVSRIQYLLANFELRRNANAEMGINIFFSGENYFITAERLQILDLLLSTYENAYHQNRDLLQAQIELKEMYEELQSRQKELAETNIKLQEVSRAKSDFLANMSHELRTPLNSIIGFSEILEDQLFGRLNEKQAEYVRDIANSGHHLLSLINDILDLSKVESGKMELDLGRFLVMDALNASMTMLKEKAMKHDIKLRLEIMPDADIEIEADKRKVKQIVFNLLSNAVKFTQAGGSVSLSARKEGDFIEISVTDTGIGIKGEDLPKLFHEFSQLESPYAKKYEGTGLGLALSKRLVDLHSGKIWCESEFGKGSRFSFAIPLGQGARKQEPGIQNKNNF